MCIRDRVILYGAGLDARIGTGDDVELARATTHSPYVFTGLVDGTYRVAVVVLSLIHI